MSRYVNYIYLTIAEVALDMSKNTNFMSFTSYCRDMAINLKQTNLSERDKRTIMVIYERLEPIFSFSMNESAIHIVNFFELSENRIRDFELAVRNTKEFFPFTGDC